MIKLELKSCTKIRLGLTGFDFKYTIIIKATLSELDNTHVFLHHPDCFAL